MYPIQTIGDLSPPPPTGPAPVLPPAVDASMLALVGAAGVALGAMGFWAWGHFAKGKRR